LPRLMAPWGQARNLQWERNLVTYLFDAGSFVWHEFHSRPDISWPLIHDLTDNRRDISLADVHPNIGRASPFGWHGEGEFEGVSVTRDIEFAVFIAFVPSARGRTTSAYDCVFQFHRIISLSNGQANPVAASEYPFQKTGIGNSDSCRLGRQPRFRALRVIITSTSAIVAPMRGFPDRTLRALGSWRPPEADAR
jgi:hypothetical protein